MDVEALVTNFGDEATHTGINQILTLLSVCLCVCAGKQMIGT